MRAVVNNCLGGPPCLYSVNFDGEDRRVHIEGKVTMNAKTDGEYVYYIDQYEFEEELINKSIEQMEKNGGKK